MTPYPQTSAYEREILKHYYMHSDADGSHMPWKGGREYWRELDHEVIARFTSLGLLIKEPGMGGTSDTSRFVANRDALSVYFHALDCVPLPVRVWKIPEFQA